MPTVTVYPITGRQLGPLRIPHRWCEARDPTIRLGRRLADGLRRDDVGVEAKPWLRQPFDALRRGDRDAPVVTIDGQVFAQGVVPDAEALKGRLRNASEDHE